MTKGPRTMRTISTILAATLAVSTIGASTVAASPTLAGITATPAPAHVTVGHALIVPGIGEFTLGTGHAPRYTDVRNDCPRPGSVGSDWRIVAWVDDDHDAATALTPIYEWTCVYGAGE